MTDAPRDLIGYGAHPPHARWPGGARIAVQFVINYEEGAERSVQNGDEVSEYFLSEMVGAQPVAGMRHMAMESLYEYGARAGFWRLKRLFDAFHVPLTVFAVAQAMERNTAAVEAMLASGWEIASHGYRWIDYQHLPEAIEREHIARAIEVHTRLTGARPLGWYQGRTSPNTARLVAQEGGFVYDADSYADDLPYYDDRYGRPQLIVPYTLDANDMRFVAPQGFNSGEQFLGYLRDTFDTLYGEGETCPKMMSVGLHCRVAGRPGRTLALRRFLEHVLAHDRVWIARRIDIARHWLAVHPPTGAATALAEHRPSLSDLNRMDRDGFTRALGFAFEKSPWVIERAFAAAPFGNVEALLRAAAAVLEAAGPGERLALIRAHPELAGRAAVAGDLTAESRAEQAAAGLKVLTPEEFERFQAINGAYGARFGFPFIICARLNDKASILAAMARRLGNDVDQEVAAAIEQILLIADFRLRDAVAA